MTIKNNIAVQISSYVLALTLIVAGAFAFSIFVAPASAEALGGDSGCCTYSTPYYSSPYYTPYSSPYSTPYSTPYATPYPTPSTPKKPTCEIDAHPYKVDYGGATTLSWTSTNATSATLSGIGTVPTNGSHVASGIVTTTTYTLTVTGPGGTANCQTTVIVKEQPPQLPSCTLSSNLSDVPYNTSITLSWSSNNATSASLNQGIGNVGLSGTRIVNNLTATVTYILTVTSPGGTADCQTTIIVREQPQLPSCTLSSNVSEVQYGGAATLSWSSNNATSASLNQSIGNVGLSGTRVVSNLNATVTYILTVTGPGGSANCQTTITVLQQPQAPSCTISANPSNVQYGGSSTLSWSSSNATSATLSDFGSVSTSGSQSTGSINDTKTYTLTVTGPGGSANCQTTVTVQQQQNLSCTISANPSNIQQGGSSYLTWVSNNATSANLSNVGSVNTNGNQTVYPSNTTTYVLTVYNAQGQSAQCQTTITVGTVYNNPPSCWITLTPQYNNTYNYPNHNNYYNQAATLTWGSNNATSAFITPNIGAVSTSGSRTVYTDGYVMYTMTVYGQGGSATCQTQTYVPPPPVYQPPVVTLTQIPYTGLDLGTVGTALYWLSILAFALSAAYLAIYYLPIFAGVKARVPAPLMEAPMQFAKSVAASVTSHPALAGWGTRDAMKFLRSENGKAPRIVITRS